MLFILKFMLGFYKFDRKKTLNVIVENLKDNKNSNSFKDKYRRQLLSRASYHT